MGDRCNCSLQFKEPPTEELLALMQEHLDDPDDTFDDRWFAYEEINYAQLPDEIYEYLVENQTGAAWHNAPGGSYGEGILIFKDGQVTGWLANDMTIVLSLQEIDRLPEAQAAQAFWDDLRK